MKTISFNLSTNSIQKAINELQAYKSTINDKVNLLILELEKVGIQATVESIEALDAVYTGELKDSIQGMYFPSEHTAIVYTNCAWAKYVLFGTGVMGANSPSPIATNFGWKYDVNEHGDLGWWYYRDGEWHWTKGMPSRDFLGAGMDVIKASVPSIAKSVFES